MASSPPPAQATAAGLLGSPSSPANKEEPTIIWSEDYLNQNTNRRNQMPYMKFALAWLFGVSFVSAVFISLLEKVPFVDALLLSTGGATAAGLNSVDITLFGKGSLTVLMICMQLGSQVGMSLIPVFVRIHALHKVIPKDMRTFNLNNYKRVPEWLVEYKALVFLTRVCLLMMLFVYAVYGLGLCLYMRGHAVLDESGADGSSVFWAAFHVVSAYNNVGYALMKTNFVGFGNDKFVVFCINMLILHGNVMYPIFLRWTIIWLSYFTPKKSSSKIYYRYLLLNGRHLYTHLFGSQQTWLLLLQQLTLISLQVAITIGLSGNHLSGNRHARIGFQDAFFEAVNVRHAGFNSIANLADVSAGVLIVFIVFM